jgi:hypothetical protein
VGPLSGKVGLAGSAGRAGRRAGLLVHQLTDWALALALARV